MSTLGPTAAGLNLLREPLERIQSPLLVPRARLIGGECPIDASVRPPGSKSLTNRALLLAALADGESTVRGALTDADDARQMIAALSQLGPTIRMGDEPGTVHVQGVSGRWRVGKDGITLNLNNAGTATRFLAATSLLASGPMTIDGNARMRERPIGELCDVLAAMGVHIEYLGKPGCPPVRLSPPPPHAAKPSDLTIPTTQSSQFISGLLLAAPWIPFGLQLKLTGDVTSASYVSMTLALLARLGATTRHSDDLRIIRVLPTEAPGRKPGLRSFDYTVEPDASGATYWWTAAAILPGARIRVLGLGASSIQGDVMYPELLGRMGAEVTRRDLPEPSIQVQGPKALKPILADMAEMPDAAMTLAAAACFAKGTSILRGLRTLRVKETDRIEATRNELRKLGVLVETTVQGDDDAMTITPPDNGIDCSPNAPPVEFDTYDDHRMAMSLALIALRRPNTFIRNPGCVAKTYPTFWAQLAEVLR